MGRCRRLFDQVPAVVQRRLWSGRKRRVRKRLNRNLPPAVIQSLVRKPGHQMVFPNDTTSCFVQLRLILSWMFTGKTTKTAVPKKTGVVKGANKDEQLKNLIGGLFKDNPVCSLSYISRFIAAQVADDGEFGDWSGWYRYDC